jgi:tripartite-type tricarboxylate transporter receptor subunit TctC
VDYQFSKPAADSRRAWFGQRLARAAVMATAAATLCSLVPVAQGADFPSRPIRLIIGQPPAGTTDLAGRIYADKLREVFGQPVVVENRPGAGTQLALQMTAQAEPDGYVLHYAGGGLSILPVTSKSWTLDAIRDLAPISQIVRGSNAIGVQPNAPYKTVDEFIAYAKANPGKLNWANISTPDLLLFTMLKRVAGIDFVTVRYNGATPAVQAVMTGQADFVSVPLGSLTDSFVKAGKIRVLAVLDNERSPLQPELPALGDSSNAALRDASRSPPFGGYWFGLVGPGKLPRDLVNALYAATAKVAKDADYLTRMRALGLQSIASTPDAFTKLIVEETAKFREIAKQAGVEPQ